MLLLQKMEMNCSILPQGNLHVSDEQALRMLISTDILQFYFITASEANT